MIHVLKITANAQGAAESEAEIRRNFIVFVRCEDIGSAYAPADAHMRQTGWQNIEIVDVKPVAPEAVEKLDESLRNAYREAEQLGVSAVLLKSQ